MNAVAVGKLAARQAVVAGGDDGKVRVWDLTNGAPVGEALVGHQDGVTAVALAESADGTGAIISGGYDGTLRIWDADGILQNVIEVGSSIRYLALTPTGLCVLSCTMGLAVLDLKLPRPPSSAPRQA
jgi:WD40 repeat protein